MGGAAPRRGLLFLDRAKYPALRARIDRVLDEAERELERMVIRVKPGDWAEIGGHPFRAASSGRKGFVQTERLDEEGFVVSSVPGWAGGSCRSRRSGWRSCEGASGRGGRADAELIGQGEPHAAQATAGRAAAGVRECGADEGWKTYMFGASRGCPMLQV